MWGFFKNLNIYFNYCLHGCWVRKDRAMCISSRWRSLFWIGCSVGRIETDTYIYREKNWSILTLSNPIQYTIRGKSCPTLSILSDPVHPVQNCSSVQSCPALSVPVKSWFNPVQSCLILSNPIHSDQHSPLLWKFRFNFKVHKSELN
jgi:hypothetical protein